MRIAILGAGISGLTAAYRLHGEHEVTVLEANDYVGGHTNTVDLELHGRRYSVDTGFIVFNDRTYPNFQALMDELGVRYIPTSMSFSVRSDVSGIEYCGSTPNGLFAQRRNLLRWRFHRMLRDIMRFNREALQDRPQIGDDLTIAEYFGDRRYSREFLEEYFYPMGAAIWSCPRGAFLKFPVGFVIDFYEHHGLLALRNRPQWFVIEGGSQTYVRALTASFRNAIRCRTPVRGVTRLSDGVRVTTGDGSETFDHVIFACHSDQALRILGANATPTERELLTAIPYEENVAVLHTDTSILPRRRRAWASWNYLVLESDPGKATVTYNMNILQGIRGPHEFCVTLNREAAIDPDKILHRVVYHHPVFSAQRGAFQRRHSEVINCNRTSFCGAYWGNGFHEDGVNSALAVVEALKSHKHEQLHLRRLDSPQAV